MNTLAIVLAAALVGTTAALILQSLRAKTACRAVADLSRRILDGDYYARLDPARCAQAKTAEALNSMLDSLVRQLSFAQGVLNGIDTPYVVVDTDEVLVKTNDSLMRILEQTGRPEDHYGHNVALFFYGEKRRTVLADSLEHHTVTSKEVELVGRKGGKRAIHIDASPLFDLAGELMGALCIYQDRTALRAKEAELVAQNQRVAEAAKRSDEVSREAARAAAVLDERLGKAARAARRQTERAVDTATAMEQMTAAVLEVARNASSSAEGAQQSRDKARQGEEVVRQSTEAMDEVGTSTETLRRHLEQLGEYAEGIGSVMNVITDIADQTNLLALNAAIEAARAGDAGRGFAVVADEVRKLAEKTMGATKEVGDSIASIQEVAHLSIENMGQASHAVDRTRDLSTASGRALQEILEMASRVTDQVQAIATAAEEQSATTEHINESVGDVRETSENLTEEMDAAAGDVRELRATVEALSRIIAEVQI
ncbi:methyl-accepting chemotaxis protein [Desulfocurvus sp. DL9XJH121]